MESVFIGVVTSLELICSVIENISIFSVSTPFSFKFNKLFLFSPSNLIVSFINGFNLDDKSDKLFLSLSFFKISSELIKAKF